MAILACCSGGDLLVAVCGALAMAAAPFVAVAAMVWMLVASLRH